MRKPLSGLVVAVGLIAALGTGSAALGATALPVFEDFETYSVGQNMDTAANWFTNAAGGSAVAQTTNVLSATKACTTSLSDLTLDVDETSGDYSNIWSQIYAKPTLYDDTVPPAAPDGTVSCAFYVNTSSEVVAYSGSSWSNLGAITTGDFLQFVVHSDYVNDKWDLFISDDATAGTAARRLNGSALSHNNAFAGSELTEVTVEGIATLDAIALAIGNDDINLRRSNVIVCAKTMTAGTQYDVAAQGHAYATGAAASLGGALGDDLLLALELNDRVTLWVNGLEIFDDDGATWDATAATITPLQAEVTPGTGLWVKKPLGGDFALFSDYNTLTVITKTIYDSTAGGGGMNRLAWDKPGPSQQAQTGGLGFAGGVAGAGDRIYLPNQGNKMIFWDGSIPGWRDGATGATAQLSPGEVFWYWRKGTGGHGTWDIGSAQ